MNILLEKLINCYQNKGGVMKLFYLFIFIMTIVGDTRYYYGHFGYEQFLCDTGTHSWIVLEDTLDTNLILDLKDYIYCGPNKPDSIEFYE